MKTVGTAYICITAPPLDSTRFRHIAAKIAPTPQ